RWATPAPGRAPLARVTPSRWLLVLCAAVALVSTVGSVAEPLAAQQLQDVVYLRDGSVIRGTIVEQIPGESVLIQTADGNRFRYTLSQVERMTREPAVGTIATQAPLQVKSPTTAGVLSALIIG